MLDCHKTRQSVSWGDTDKAASKATAQQEGLAILRRIADRQAAEALTLPNLRLTVPIPASGPGPESGGRTGIRAVITAGLITGTILGITAGLHASLLPGGHLTLRIGWYGISVTFLIGAKMLLSLLAAPAPETPQSRSLNATAEVAAVITIYNEDPEAFGKCLSSLLAQSVMPASVTVIDDGSGSPACADLALRYRTAFAARGSSLDLIRFPVNRGKREGLAAGFASRPRAWAYLCVDSDTILKDDALERLIRQMAADDVQAVTGSVLAANRTRNLLTRLIDLRYCYAFLGERAAYSVLGSVLCVCGSLALYRGAMARENAERLTGQRFLGRPCTYGDDRHMTFLALKRGRVVLEPAAVAWTLVPERLGHFIRQQLRWNKSFFRESLWMLARMSPRRACWWLTLIEIGTWFTFTTALLYSLAVRPAETGHFAGFAYLASVILLSYARAGHYAEADHPGMGSAARYGTLLLAPLYGVLHITLLLPLRMVALATLRDNGWGTRGDVEVSA